MDQLIECPICEERFQLDEANQERIISCPSCQRKFLADSASRVTQQATTRPLSTAIAPSKKPPSDEIDPRARDSYSNRDHLKESMPEAELSKVGPAGTSPKKYPMIRKARRKNQNMLIATSVVFALIAAALGSLLYLQVSKFDVLNQDGLGGIADGSEIEAVVTSDSEGATSDSDDSNLGNSEQTDRPSDTESGASDSTSNTSSNDIATSRQSALKFAELPKRKTRYFNQRELNDCWKLVQPYLVSLTIHNARGTHEAIGTVVDSRGWILTSYQAIVGAHKIEVTASPKQIDFLDDEHLRDEVRGIVASASDPERDIAVLAINLRFVIRFAELKVASFKKIVPGAFVVQNMPPSESRPYGRTEASILHRDRIDLLATSELVRQRQLENPDMEWLVATSKADAIPGTPLTTIEGELVGMNSFGSRDEAHYVMLSDLRTMLDHANEEVQPLIELGGATSEEGPVVMNSEHPMLAEVQKLNQAGTQCEEFNWIAEDESQFQQLQEFGKQMVNVSEYLRAEPDQDLEMVKPVKEQVSRWTNTLMSRYSFLNAEDQTALKKMHRMSEREFENSDRIIPVLGDVFLSAFEMNGRLMFQFIDGDTFVVVPDNPESTPKLPEQKFLLFIKTPEKPVVKNYDIGGEILTSYAGELVFDVGPIE